MTTQDFTKDGPDVCPVCKRRCVTVPDKLVEGGKIHVHRARRGRPGDPIDILSRCTSSKVMCRQCGEQEAKAPYDICGACLRSREDATFGG